MRAEPARRARIRTILIIVILATLPCYCLGWVALQVGRAPACYRNTHRHPPADCNQYTYNNHNGRIYDHAFQHPHHHPDGNAVPFAHHYPDPHTQPQSYPGCQ